MRIYVYASWLDDCCHIIIINWSPLWCLIILIVSSSNYCPCWGVRKGKWSSKFDSGDWVVLLEELLPLNLLICIGLWIVGIIRCYSFEDECSSSFCWISNRRSKRTVTILARVCFCIIASCVYWILCTLAKLCWNKCLTLSEATCNKAALAIIIENSQLSVAIGVWVTKC